MAQKHQLIELDGMYGLIADAETEIPQNTDLNQFYIYWNETTGEIRSMREKWKLFYGESLITKGSVPFDAGGEYIPKGPVHYLDKRLSVDRFATTPKEELDALFDKFKRKHPDMQSHFEKTLQGRFVGFVRGLMNGYGKLNDFTASVEKKQLDMIDSQFPGAKMGLEHIGRKTVLAIDQAEGKLEKKLDDLEIKKQPAPPGRKPSLNSIIGNASARAATQGQQQKAPSIGRGQSTPFDERSLF